MGFNLSSLSKNLLIIGGQIMSGMFKLDPFFSEKVWGYEKWNLSTHRNGCSVLENSNINLYEHLQKQLPILIKIIKAKDSLSVQVHPGDEFANQYENDNGKTECWYILDADEGASLICGIKEGLDKESFKKVLEDGAIANYLGEIEVKAGDMIYIPSGTIHAIKGGIKLLEVQQSSDVTYRIYDWGRDREMHIEKALEVIDYNPQTNGGKIENFKKLETPYFNVEKVIVDGVYHDEVTSDFYSYTVTKGTGVIKGNEQEITLHPEETIYLSKGITYTIKGNLELIKTA